jgi:hypothetical protein
MKKDVNGYQRGLFRAAVSAAALAGLLGGCIGDVRDFWAGLEPDASWDTGGDADADADADGDTDTDADSDTDPQAVCPTDMVPVPASAALGVNAPFCLDRYEASRNDATAVSMGSDTSIARSVAGVIPWSVNPMGEAHLATFEAACQAAGKHLCTEQEWYLSCTGTAQTIYSWGNTFDREICNCVDTFCDDYCATQGVPSGDCYTASDCGYHRGAECPAGSCADATCSYPYCSGSVWCHDVRPTGSFPGCTDEFGAFDVNGNLWEIVTSTDDPYGRPYEVRGGAYNCASAAARLMCTFNANWTALNAGFRCCRAPD